MKKYIAIFAAFAVIYPAARLLAADPADTVTYNGYVTPDMRKITVAWTGDDTDCTNANTTVNVGTGNILFVTTDPGATAPADNYDLQIQDEDGVDVMGLELENRDTATSEQAMPKMGNHYGPRPVYGDLTITYTNTANADCEGEIFLYIGD